MIAPNRMNSDDNDRPGSNGEDFTTATGARAAKRVMLNELLPGFLEDVLTGEPPPEYAFDERPWGTLALRPRQVTCIGGPPNGGKTCLMMQMITGALLINPTLRAIIACVEMDERILMERTLARLSGVYLGKILKRERDEFYIDRIERAVPQLESLADRLMFIQRPFSLPGVLQACDEFQPHVVCLDYLQRLSVDDRAVDIKQQVNRVMTQVRLLADQGVAVLTAAALNRQASSQTQSRAESRDDNVNDLAAFRDSSDIEYSIDDAFLLTKVVGNTVTLSEEEYRPKKMSLRHVKSRNNMTMHIPLTFDGRLQEFKLRPWDGGEDDQRIVGPIRGAGGGTGRPQRGWSVDTFLGPGEDGNGPQRV